MSYKLEQSIVPPPGTDTTVACDFEISESSSKLPAFFPRKTKCTPAETVIIVLLGIKSTKPLAVPKLVRNEKLGEVSVSYIFRVDNYTDVIENFQSYVYRYR